MFFRELKRDILRLDNNFAGMLKINGNFTVHNRLYLSKAPVFANRVSDKVAGFKAGDHVAAGFRFSKRITCPMFHDRQNLAALIGSRICHDLISPLGAISNGLELLAMSGQAATPELALIGESIAAANSKIRFFRVAYGTAPPGSTLAQGEIAAILRDYFNGVRADVVWHPVREIQRREVKIAFVAIQCLESALPYGGRINVRRDDQGWCLSAQSEKLRLNPDHWALLQDQEKAVDLAAAQVQFGMLLMLTRWRTPSLHTTLGGTSVEIRF